MKTYLTLLREHDLKATPQRNAILKIMGESGHISIEKIYERIRSAFPSLSLATIYKNIIALQEKDIIRELKIPGEKNHYELKKEPHHHIVCQKCGTITDIDADMERSLKDISLKYNFDVSEISLSVSGICHTCKSHH